MIEIAYFDTSALAKRYVDEVGSEWISSLCRKDSGWRIYIAELATVELASVVVRRSRGGLLASEDAKTILERFDADLVARYYVLEMTSDLFSSARSLVGTHGLRSLDALQLSAAINLNTVQCQRQLPPITFISADADLLSAASLERLKTENPINYRS